MSRIDREKTDRRTASSQSWAPTSLLAHLSVGTREAMLNLGVARHYRRGQVLMREGDRTTHAVLLRSGFVKVSAVTDSGRIALLAIRMSGDLIGELGAIDGAPRAATVAASVDVVGNEIGRAELLGFLRRHPDASFAIAGMIGDRLRMANRRRLDIMGFAAKARIARILLELGERFGNDISHAQGFKLAITQQELAELAGVTQISVQRVLRALRTKGLLTTGYRRITVLRADAMRVEGELPSGANCIM